METFFKLAATVTTLDYCFIFGGFFFAAFVVVLLFFLCFFLTKDLSVYYDEVI